MSYDLMVFDASAAPLNREAFLAWVDQQSEWDESHGYDNPDVLTPTLRAWFYEMIESFPPMNGPLASDDVDNPKLTDYSLGRSIISGAFAWSQAEPAFARTVELAAKYRVGVYEISSETATIWIPAADGFEKIP